MRWHEIDPADAVDIDCRERPDLRPPLNEAGEPCPWPWEPQQMAGAPVGMFHCRYCGDMVVAGISHPDYRPVLAAEQLMLAIGGEEPDLEFAMRMVRLSQHIAERGHAVPVVTAAAGGQTAGVLFADGEWAVSTGS